MSPGPAVPGCCFVSFHFMWAKLYPQAVDLLNITVTHIVMWTSGMFNLFSVYLCFVSCTFPITTERNYFRPPSCVTKTPICVTIHHDLEYCWIYFILWRSSINIWRSYVTTPCFCTKGISRGLKVRRGGPNKLCSTERRETIVTLENTQF